MAESISTEQCQKYSTIKRQNSANVKRQIDYPLYMCTLLRIKTTSVTYFFTFRPSQIICEVLTESLSTRSW